MGTKEFFRHMMPVSAVAAAILLSGCVSSQVSEENMKRETELAAQEADVKKAEMALKSREADLAKAEKMGGRSSNQAYFPPTPKPGECFARVLTPAVYGEASEKVLVREASERIEVSPPQYAVVTEKVLVQEGYARTIIIPAEYGTKTEKILVRPASKRLVPTAPEYKTVTERVLDTPARTQWKRGSAVVDGALQTRIDNETGDIMCLVEIPATYKELSKTVLAKKAGTKEIAIPAEYRTVSRTVVTKPESKKVMKVPAEYRMIQKQKLVKPAAKKTIKIPAEYTTVTKRVLKTAETINWRAALCDVNLTAQNITTMQQALTKSGAWKGDANGRLSASLMNAVNAFAKSKKLPHGENYISLETAAALGVK